MGLLGGPYGLLIKYGGLAVIVLSILGVTFYKGTQYTQQQWDAAIAAQAIDAANTVIEAAQNTARIESEFQKKLDAQARRVKVVTKEVKVYVDSPSKKCELSPEFVTVFDALSGLHDAAPDGVPAAADATGAVAILPEATVTDAAVLAVHQLSTVELANLWDTYAALVEWTRSSHKIASEGAGR